MATKRDSNVTSIVAGFGGAKATDILNRLWVMGIDPNKLKNALAQSTAGGVGTNDPSDIVARLLNQGTVTADQLKQAPTVPVPNISGPSWPFQPDHLDQNGVVVPVHTNPYSNYVDTKTNTPLPNAQIQIPGSPTPPITIPQTTAPTPAPAARSIVTQTTTTPDAKKPPPSPDLTPEQYQQQNYSGMLWVKDIPELASKLADAAKYKWTPAQFQGELEGTDWWKTHSDSLRKYTTLRADPATYQQSLSDHSSLVKTIAGTYGITLNDEQVNTLADNWLKFGWDPKIAQQSVVNMATYDPNQGGAIGAQVGAVKGLAKDYFMPMSDQDAWNYARNISAGTMTADTVTGLLREQAKSSYPSLADIIDKGGTPKQAMSGQINMAAQLLEVDPSTVDLTTPQYNQIIAHADDKGQVRPMTTYETSQFVKNKDEYWKTNNANKEVSGILGQLGSVFGKTGMG